MPIAAADQIVEEAQRRLAAEKAPRDALHDLGLEAVRWGFTELGRDLDAVVRRAQARRAAADPSRFTGVFGRRPRNWIAPAPFRPLPCSWATPTRPPTGGPPWRRP